MSNADTRDPLEGKRKLLREWASRMHHEMGIRVILAYVEVLFNLRLRLRSLLWDCDGCAIDCDEVLALLEEVNQRIARELPPGVLLSEEEQRAET